MGSRASIGMGCNRSEIRKYRCVSRAYLGRMQGFTAAFSGSAISAFPFLIMIMQITMG